MKGDSTVSRLAHLTTAVISHNVVWVLAQVWFGNNWARLQLKLPKVIFLQCKYSPQARSFNPAALIPHVFGRACQIEEKQKAGKLLFRLALPYL